MKRKSCKHWNQIWMVFIGQNKKFSKILQRVGLVAPATAPEPSAAGGAVENRVLRIFPEKFRAGQRDNIGMEGRTAMLGNEVLSTDRTAGTFVRVGKNSGTGLTPGDGQPDARRVLGGTDEVSGPVEDDELRQEEWQKLVEENWKLREAFEVLQRWQASFEGSATPGP